MIILWTDTIKYQSAALIINHDSNVFGPNAESGPKCVGRHNSAPLCDNAPPSRPKTSMKSIIFIVWVTVLLPYHTERKASVHLTYDVTQSHTEPSKKTIVFKTMMAHIFKIVWVCYWLSIWDTRTTFQEHMITCLTGLAPNNKDFDCRQQWSDFRWLSYTSFVPRNISCPSRTNSCDKRRC